MTQHFDALAHKLYASTVSRDDVNHAAWLRSNAEGSPVGTCRVCGGHLRASQPGRHNGVDTYEATCDACGHDYVAPNGRTLRGSSRHSEMPPGWWEARQERLKPGSGGL